MRLFELEKPLRRGWLFGCTLHVDEANGAARALYASEGFVATGRRPDYYAVGRHAIAMQLELQSE